MNRDDSQRSIMRVGLTLVLVGIGFPAFAASGESASKVSDTLNAASIAGCAEAYFFEALPIYCSLNPIEIGVDSSRSMVASEECADGQCLIDEELILSVRTQGETQELILTRINKSNWRVLGHVKEILSASTGGYERGLSDGVKQLYGVEVSVSRDVPSPTSFVQIMGISSTALGGIGLGLGAYFGIKAQGLVEEANSLAVGSHPTAIQAQDYNRYANTSLGIGAALVAAGLYLWLDDRWGSSSSGSSGLSSSLGLQVTSDAEKTGFVVTGGW